MSDTEQKSIRERRVAAGKTIRQVAIGIGVTERTYFRWESGEGTPDGANLVRLADFFGVHPRELLSAPAEQGR